MVTFSGCQRAEYSQLFVEARVKAIVPSLHIPTHHTIHYQLKKAGRLASLKPFPIFSVKF